MFTQREDYLLRHIRLLAAALLAAWRRSDHAPAEVEAAAQATGLDLDMAARLRPDALVALLTTSDGIDAGRALPLALALAGRGQGAHVRALIEAVVAQNPELDSAELREVVERSAASR